jgi:hypothetical protein
MIDGYMGMGVRGHKTGDFPAPPVTFSYGPIVCDCGYAGRHSKLRHWLRLRYLKERW